MRLRKRLKFRGTNIFVITAIFTFMSSAYIICYVYNSAIPKRTKGNEQKHIEDTVPAFSEKYTMKTILLWSDVGLHPFDLFLEGSLVFESLKCTDQNCYVTTDKNLFGGNRSPSQDYIYFNTESADYYPVCDQIFDGFFNMTATYRLDSDFFFNYFDIKNKKGKVIGPGINMDWVDGLEESTGELNFNKTKAVAWFATECQTRSPRMLLAKKLQQSLQSHGYTLDIYGNCGNIQCSWNNKTQCNMMLRNDYYFYFSAENSFCEDYVTEEVLIALQNDVVPIVYGGADYYRFLPPHSFIDARAYSAEELARLIVKLIDYPDLYQHYFGWKDHYKYHLSTLQTQICAVCKTLNRDPKTNMVYEQFRKWWYPKFEKRC